MKRYLDLGREYAEHCWAVFLTPSIRLGDTIKVGLILGCVFNAILSGHLDRQGAYAVEIPHIVEVAQAEEPDAKTVLIEVEYNWDPEQTEREIRQVFVDEPGLAVAVAKCESQFHIQSDLNIQAKAQLWYGQERSFGLFQIHEPDWHQKAISLGYGDYQTNPRSNIHMAKWIRDNSGWHNWVCFSKGYYQKHL